MTKTYVLAIMLLVAFLAIFIPFASSNPDGLEAMTSSLGVKAQSIWQGLMGDYSVSALGQGYGSTLLAGALGIVFVLTATLALGKAITKRSEKN